MSAILFWFVIKPISLLPYWMLYGISDFFYLILYYLIGYRKKVVRSNLKRCFPEKSEKQLIEIEKKFFRHLCDLIVESLKNFSITKKQAAARMSHHNLEVFQQFAAQKQSVILAGGHYGNWELWAVGAAEVIPHKLVGIYKKLNNAYFDKKMKESRSRFGLHLVNTREIGAYVHLNKNELNVIGFAFDQSPSNPKKCVWVQFMGNETAALFGTEKYAVQYNRPVIYANVKKWKRGHYSVNYQLVCEHPAETANEYLTQLLYNLLEKDIMAAPEYWLWSHKRWKHKRPAEHR